MIKGFFQRFSVFLPTFSCQIAIHPHSKNPLSFHPHSIILYQPSKVTHWKNACKQKYYFKGCEKYKKSLFLYFQENMIKKTLKKGKGKGVFPVTTSSNHQNIKNEISISLKLERGKKYKKEIFTFLIWYILYNEIYDDFFFSISRFFNVENI